MISCALFQQLRILSICRNAPNLSQPWAGGAFHLFSFRCICQNHLNLKVLMTSIATVILTVTSTMILIESVSFSLFKAIVTVLAFTLIVVMQWWFLGKWFYIRDVCQPVKASTQVNCLQALCGTRTFGTLRLKRLSFALMRTDCRSLVTVVLRFE